MNIEIVMKDNYNISIHEMRSVIKQIYTENPTIFNKDLISPHEIPFINNNYSLAINSIKCDGSGELMNLYIYHLNESEPFEDKMENDGEVLSLATTTILPSKRFENLWDSIIIDEDDNQIKDSLLNFLSTSLLFSDHGVSSDFVTCNRIILFYGPPGTGKTSLCQGLSQKLCIKFSERYSQGILLEVNTHSLFSKWFSESGKMVQKLFEKLNSLSNETDTIIFLLIDEVESLATARQSSMNGSDPSDAIRVVNALLTQIDKLRKNPNVIILTTSNMTECIDFAFISRADIKQYIGPPTKRARYEIFKGCIEELIEKFIIITTNNLLKYDDINSFLGNSLNGLFEDSIKLLKCVELTEGMSGRILRRLPFLSFVYSSIKPPINLCEFLEYLRKAIEKEIEDQEKLKK